MGVSITFDYMQEVIVMPFLFPSNQGWPEAKLHVLVKIFWGGFFVVFERFGLFLKSLPILISLRKNISHYCTCQILHAVTLRHIWQCLGNSVVQNIGYLMFAFRKICLVYARGYHEFLILVFSGEKLEPAKGVSLYCPPFWKSNFRGTFDEQKLWVCLIFVAHCEWIIIFSFNVISFAENECNFRKVVLHSDALILKTQKCLSISQHWWTVPSLRSRRLV